MAVKYVASIQVPYTTGFWMPHTECDYITRPFDSLAQALAWLALADNQSRLASDSAEAVVALRVNGTTLVLWELTRRETVTSSGRVSW